MEKYFIVLAIPEEKRFISRLAYYSLIYDSLRFTEEKDRFLSPKLKINDCINWKIFYCTRSTRRKEISLSTTHHSLLYGSLRFIEGRGRTACMHPMWRVACCRTCLDFFVLIWLKQGSNISQVCHWECSFGKSICPNVCRVTDVPFECSSKSEIERGQERACRINKQGS